MPADSTPTPTNTPKYTAKQPSKLGWIAIVAVSILGIVGFIFTQDYADEHPDGAVQTTLEVLRLDQ